MTTAAPARPGLLTTYKALTVVSAVLVLVLAVLAGHSANMSGTGDIAVHGYLGEALFAISVVMVVLSFMTQTKGVVVGHAVGFAALCFAQVGLGFIGRETLSASAWHIANGVLIMGVAVAHLSLVLRPPAD